MRLKYTLKMNPVVKTISNTICRRKHDSSTPLSFYEADNVYYCKHKDVIVISEPPVILKKESTRNNEGVRSTTFLPDDSMDAESY